MQAYTTKCNYNKKTGVGTIRIENDCFVRLPKVGLVRFAKSREIEGKLLSATVRRTPSGKYFISLLTEQAVHSSQSSLFEVGIDVGLKDFATFSDGTKLKNPKWFCKLEEKLAKEQRILSRRQVGSANWNKQRIKVARIHEKIVNIHAFGMQVGALDGKGNAERLAEKLKAILYTLQRIKNFQYEYKNKKGKKSEESKHFNFIIFKSF